MTEEINMGINKRYYVTKRPHYTSISQITSVKLPVQLLKQIDELIERGFFQNRSDAFREALRRLVRDYMIDDNKRPVVGYR